MHMSLILLSVLSTVQALWIWWLLWDRGKKIRAISERRKDIRILKREIKRMEELLKGE